ncbi:E3 ubiquitin-protein ligase RNF25 [Cylas formicarius]|uniref:E3 ubiquitin-protein ligase RNF25 n=1 Tax=Cylas formicarius TaxID=197179 RepID=UPI002958AC2C|nr:E3 ubiquitin-protein ligase RNF25 [Cylas formicarius]
MSSNERVQEELEALEAILMDDISITYDNNGCAELVKSIIFPSTGNEVDKQYVCVTLEVSLPEGYPDIKPIIQLRNPRGLDDSTIEYLNKALRDKCDEYLGQPVIFELIELIRENLTQSNLPTCQCTVCLYGFSEGDSFTKTQCFHYFHSYCLAKHIIVTEKHFKEEQEKLPAWKRCSIGYQATCPVCREQITCDVADLRKAPPPIELEKAQNFELTRDLRIFQEKMKELYNYQKSRGGIIDVEAEENKLLLITNSNDNSTSENTNAGPSLSSSVNDETVENEVLNRNQRFQSKYTHNR